MGVDVCNCVFDFGCVDPCKNLDTGIPANVTGTFIFYFQYLDEIIEKEVEGVQGQSLVVDFEGLNEFYPFTFYITTPGGERVNVVTLTDEYNCFKVETKMGYPGNPNLLLDAVVEPVDAFILNQSVNRQVGASAWIDRLLIGESGANSVVQLSTNGTLGELYAINDLDLIAYSSPNLSLRDGYTEVHDRLLINTTLDDGKELQVNGEAIINEKLTFLSGDEKGIRILKDDLTDGVSIYTDSTQDYSRFESSGIWTAVAGGQEVIRLIGATAQPKLTMSNDITFGNSSGDRFEIDQTGRIGMGASVAHPTGIDVSLNGVSYTDQLLVNTTINSGEELQVGGDALIEGILVAGAPNSVLGTGHKIGALNIDYDGGGNPRISGSTHVAFGNDLVLDNIARIESDPGNTSGLRLYTGRSNVDFSVTQRPDGIDTLTFHIDGVTKRATHYGDVYVDNGLVSIDNDSGLMLSLKRSSVSGSSWSLAYNADSALQLFTALGGSYKFGSTGDFEVLNGRMEVNSPVSDLSKALQVSGDSLFDGGIYFDGNDFIQRTSDGKIEVFANGSAVFGSSGAGTMSSKNISPYTSNTYRLGATNLRWQDYYGVNLNLNGDLTINNETGVSGSFISADAKMITVTKGIVTNIN